MNDDGNNNSFKEKSEINNNVIESITIEATKAVHIKLADLQAVFEDDVEYNKFFDSPITVESEDAKKIVQKQEQNNVRVRWDDNSLYFKPGSNASKVSVHDLATVRNQDWFSHAQVTKIPDHSSDEMKLQLFSRENVPNDKREGFTIHFTWNPIVYKRKCNALKGFRRLPETIKSMLLGKECFEYDSEIHSFSSIISAPNLPALNTTQGEAVRHVLRRPIAIIQGPPGTGKTVTSATIIHKMIEMGIKPILICAPSNIAVNNLTEKVSETGVRVTRVFAATLHDIKTPVSHIGLHNKIKDEPEFSTIRHLRDERKHRDLSQSEKDNLNSLIRKVERKVLMRSDVVAATCIGAGHYSMDSIEFAACLIDEVTQSSEPECLVPIVQAGSRLRHVILVGDHKQLGPVIASDDPVAKVLERSLFDRLLAAKNVDSLMLDIQYRMHPHLSFFPNQRFYNGKLGDGVTHRDRRFDIKFKWPKPGFPLMFSNITGKEEMVGTSYMNTREANRVSDIVSELIRNGASGEQIGIITPYEAQRTYFFRSTRAREYFRNVEIASVDAFQGREKDIIIISCVRSNDDRMIGFVRNPNRLNVALTRAKLGLIIVGNSRVLERCRHWRDLIRCFKRIGVFTGPDAEQEAGYIHYPKSDQPSKYAELGEKLLTWEEQQKQDLHNTSADQSVIQVIDDSDTESHDDSVIEILDNSVIIQDNSVKQISDDSVIEIQDDSVIEIHDNSGDDSVIIIDNSGDEITASSDSCESDSLLHCSKEDSASPSSNDSSDEDNSDDDTKDNLAIHISEDYIKSLVKSLGAQKNSIQFEAAKALTGLTTATGVLTGTQVKTGVRKFNAGVVRKVVDAGTVPILIKLLSLGLKSHKGPKKHSGPSKFYGKFQPRITRGPPVSKPRGFKGPPSSMEGVNKEQVQEEVLLILGNIAAESPEFRDLLLDAGILDPLLLILTESKSVSLLRKGVWVLSHLCAGQSPPHFSKVCGALEVLPKLLSHEDEIVLTDTCNAIANLADGDSENIQAVIDSGVCPRIVDLLSHSSQTIVLAALRTVGNICSGDNTKSQVISWIYRIQVIIDCGALDSLLKLLSCDMNDSSKTDNKEADDDIKEKVCRTISNILASADTHLIQSVIDANIFPVLFNAQSEADLKIRKEVACAIKHSVQFGTSDQVRYIVGEGCIAILYDFLTTADSEIIQVVLEGLEQILLHGEEGDLKLNPYAAILENILKRTWWKQRLRQGRSISAQNFGYLILNPLKIMKGYLTAIP